MRTKLCLKRNRQCIRFLFYKRKVYDWPHLTSLIGAISKLFTGTKDMQMAYKSHRATIYDSNNPGEICCKLSSLLHLNIFIFKDAKTFGADFSNIMALYPSNSNRCIPIIHWTEVNKRHKASRFQSFILNKYYSKVNNNSGMIWVILY